MLLEVAIEIGGVVGIDSVEGSLLVGRAVLDVVEESPSYRITTST